MKHLSTLLAAVALSASPLLAQSAATPPAGAITYSITGGTLASPRITTISVPLRDSVPSTPWNGTAGYTGVSSGVIAGVAVGTAANRDVISVTGAGWDIGQFRSATQPYFLRVMSGPAVGRTLAIVTGSTVAHTATSVIVDNQDASLVGVVSAGDKFEIFQGETLGTFFADMLAQGALLTNTAFNQADFVQVFSGSGWVTYFHNGTRWQLQTSNLGSSNNVVIRPDSGIIFGRRGTNPVNLTALGTVPTTDLKVVVRNAGATPVANLFPVSRTLSTLGIQAFSGWTNADRVQIHSGTSWVNYTYTTQWTVSGLPSNPSLNITRPLIIVESGATPGVTVRNFTLPYTL